MSKEKRIVNSRRACAQKAVSLLWADNSEDEVEDFDSEDLKMIENDI